MICFQTLAAVTLPPVLGPVSIVVGVIIIGGIIVGIIYYNSKAKETLDLTAADHCHVKMTPVSGVQYNTVDCEGICKTTTCMLYSRPRGSEARWVRTTPGHQEDTTREYRCFCHDPNRKEGDF